MRILISSLPLLLYILCLFVCLFGGGVGRGGGDSQGIMLVIYFFKFFSFIVMSFSRSVHLISGKIHFVSLLWRLKKSQLYLYVQFVVYKLHQWHCNGLYQKLINLNKSKSGTIKCHTYYIVRACFILWKAQRTHDHHLIFIFWSNHMVVGKDIE